MKMLCAVFVALCMAGAVRGQAAGVACGAGDACDANLVCQEGSDGTKKCRIKITGSCTAGQEKCVVTAPVCPSGNACECPVGATANSENTVCSCTDNTKVINDDRSKCVSKEGGTCSAADDCIADSVCTGTPKVCACDTNFVINDAKDKCLAKASQACSVASDCLPNADCTGNVCVCKTNFVASTDNAKCLSHNDQACSSNDDCVANAMCDTKCKCNENYITTWDMSQCRLAPEQPCTDSSQCGENAECPSGSGARSCACKDGYDSKEKGRCGKKVDATCSTAADCVPDADCTGSQTKTCQCKTDFTEENGFCSGASAVTTSLILLLAAFVVSRWM